MQIVIKTREEKIISNGILMIEEAVKKDPQYQKYEVIGKFVHIVFKWTLKSSTLRKVLALKLYRLKFLNISSSLTGEMRLIFEITDKKETK